MKRYINKMTLYSPQPCIRGKDKYVTIKNVASQQENRISRTYGNINLTDYWFTILDDSVTQDLAYIGQDFLLLCDDEADWWGKQLEKGYDNFCICFVKVDTDSAVKQDDVQQYILRCAEGKGNVKFFYTFGNADFIVAISASEHTVLREVYDGIKDKEDFYYSLNAFGGRMQRNKDGEYRILLIDNEYKSINKPHDVFDEGWCAQTVGQLKAHMKIDKEKYNKKKLSYYHALLQIMNVISQYEQSEIRKDMFYIFYPQIDLFLKQLSKGETAVEKHRKHVSTEAYQCEERIENSLGKFIDLLETMLYHIGQSCRTMIESTGVGGLAYDIPIRLCFMYVAYLNVLTGILNDKEEYRYQFCLYPLAYSKPSTECFEFGLEAGSRLISFQVSKPMMYMPRSLFIIGAHEVSHYVGQSSRLRSVRAECYLATAIMVLTNEITNNEIVMEAVKKSNFHKEILKEYLGFVEKNVFQYLCETIYTEWEKKYGNKSYKYYLDDFIIDLNQIIYERTIIMVSDLSNVINTLDENLLQKISEEMQNEVTGNDSLYEELFDIQQRIRLNVGQAWHSRKTKLFMTEFAQNLREIYADISAILVLNLTAEDFFETYLVSESYIPNESIIRPELLNRMAIVVKIMVEKDFGEWKTWLLEENGQKNDENFLISSKMTWRGKEFVIELKQQIKEYLLFGVSENGTILGESDSPISRDYFYSKEIIDREIDYFSQCYDAIKMNLDKRCSESNEEAKRQHIVRTLFKQFQVCLPEEDTSYKELLAAYEDLIGCYKQDVRKFMEKVDVSKGEYHE